MGRSTQNSKKPKARPRGKPFPKGASANPGGRPKSAEANEIIRELFKANGQDVIRRLYSFTKGKDKKLALAAIREILDRVMGRPNQALDVKTTEVPVTQEQLVCELRQVLRKKDPKLVERLAKAVARD